MSVAQTWLAALLLVVGFVYVGVPLIALATQKPRAHPSVFQLPSFDEVKGEDLDAGIMLERSVASLQALGFRTGLPVRIELSGKMQGFAAVGVAANGDVAESYVAVQQVNGRILRRQWTTFHSHTQSFSQTITSNIPMSTGIRPVAGYKAFRAIDVTDLPHMYALHELCVHDSGGRRRNPPVPEDHAAYVGSEIARGQDNMCVRGYAWRPRANANALRLTPKGAFLMMWRQLPPMRQIVRARARRRVAEMEERLARETGATRAA